MNMHRALPVRRHTHTLTFRFHLFPSWIEFHDFPCPHPSLFIITICDLIKIYIPGAAVVAVTTSGARCMHAIAPTTTYRRPHGNAPIIISPFVEKIIQKIIL